MNVPQSTSSTMNTVLQDYAPVVLMRQKAAELRAELAEAGVTPTVFKPMVSMKPQLTIHVPDPDHVPGKQSRVSTPAQPRFKPQRAHVTKHAHSDEDPFTPVGPSAKIGHRALSARSSGHVGELIDSRTSVNSLGGTTARRQSSIGPEQLSPSSSIVSRRSSSPIKHGPTSRRPSSRALRASLANQEAQAALAARVVALETLVSEWQSKAHDLEDGLQKRQDSYMRREEALQAQIAQLQEALAVARGDHINQDAGKVDLDKGRKALKQLHGQVVGEIESLLKQQEVTLKYDEQTQARRLKGQLAQLELELTAERGATGRTNAEWLQRTAGMRQELDDVQAIASKLDAMYKLSEEECRRLRAQFKCQEDDRELLVRQVVGLRKENKRMSVELATFAADAAAAAKERDEALASLQDAGVNNGQAGVAKSSNIDLDKLDPQTFQVKVQRYEAVIDSLKKLCEAERRRTRQARAAHTAELAARTELQTILRQLVDDVRAKAAEVKSGADSQGAATAQGTQQQTPATESQANEHSNDDDEVRVVYQPGTAAANTRGSANGNKSAVRPTSAVMSALNGHVPRPTRPVSAIVRPSSGLPARDTNGWLPHNGFVGNRPLSASRPPRPQSAVVTTGHQRQAHSEHHHQQGPAGGLLPPERQLLMNELVKQESLLMQLINKAFPCTGPPSLPEDLDRLAAARDARDATVVANARMLGHTRTAGMLKTPSGNETLKVAAGKPWVFNVDNMLSSFLSNNANSSADEAK